MLQPSWQPEQPFVNFENDEHDLRGFLQSPNRGRYQHLPVSENIQNLISTIINTVMTFIGISL